MSTTPSHTKQARAGEDISDRILAATTSVILRDGPRRLRTAEIAKVAGTTESTIYRHFQNLDQLLLSAYEHAWDVLNAHVGAAAFTRPVTGNPLQTLLGDTEAIFQMRSDRDSAEAALLALLFMRRGHEFLPDGIRSTESQRRFEERLESIAASVVDSYPPPSGEREEAVHLLRTLVMNYMATIWFTWELMPAGTDDITAQVRDLTPAEAQMGVLTLVERVVGGPLEDLSGAG